jgi:GABA permease
MRRYLVVANQTLGGEPLMREIRKRRGSEPSSFHVLVPATPVSEHGTWTEGKARAVATERLEHMLASLRSEGVPASGQVGDANPLFAIDDVLRNHEIDEIIISTLPPGISRWLRQDLVHRVTRRFDRPVTHVVTAPAHAV